VAVAPTATAVPATQPPVTPTQTPVPSTAIPPTATAVNEVTRTAPTVAPTEASWQAVLSEVALLPPGLLRDLAGDAGSATPAGTASPEATLDGPTLSARGDGTGALSLVPGEVTELPDNAPDGQTPTPSAP
jgi:hypothetical protein